MSNIAKRPNGKWRARYRDDSGRQHARHFDRKVDAQRWLNEVTAARVTGQYVDPNAGKITFREYAETWREAQVHRPSSAIHVEGQLRRHAYPTFGDRQLATILPSEIQAWVRRLGTADKRAGRKALGAETISVLHSIVSAIFRAAVRDRKIIANPCEGTRLPSKDAKRVVPLTTDQVDRLRSLMPDELKAMVTFTAGTGMRQGEVFGLTLDRIDFLSREVRVDRQLATRPGRGRTEFGPTKTPASNRTIPLPQVVVDALAVHLRDHPAGETGLVFTLGGAPITRYAFGHLWRPIANEVGIETGTGMHALRHYYASLLIRFGESVKTVQVRLGHASASETLDTYSHLWPDSADRTRAAIDSVLGAPDADEHPAEAAR
jgi:integrase